MHGDEPTLWIKDPLAILADGADRGVVLRGGRIVELVPKGRSPTAPNVELFDAGAHVVLPGLINTHHHFYQTLTRAVPAALDRELFPWLQALYPVWARLTPEALDLGMTLAMAELILSGCTTTTDHHYVFPAGLEGAVDIEVEAAKRLGLRVLLTRGSMNRSQRDGGLPPDSVVQDEDTILADSARVVSRYHQAGDGAMVQIGLAPCSPFSVTTSLMQSTAVLAGRLNVRLHTHLGETEDENRYCQEVHNCRPLDYLEDCGWLNDRVWLAHGIHFTASEMARLAQARTTICHCPCSNQSLASGTCPVCAMEEAGVRVGLGVDGSASNDGSNLMQEVRAAFSCSAAATASKESVTSMRCAGRRKAPRLAQDERTLARSPSARWPISRCSSSTSRVFPAAAMRSRRLFFAAPTTRTTSWWADDGSWRTAKSRDLISAR